MFPLQVQCSNVWLLCFIPPEQFYKGVQTYFLTKCEVTMPIFNPQWQILLTKSKDQQERFEAGKFYQPPTTILHTSLILGCTVALIKVTVSMLLESINWLSLILRFCYFFTLVLAFLAVIYQILTTSPRNPREILRKILPFYRFKDRYDIFAGRRTRRISLLDRYYYI